MGLGAQVPVWARSRALARGGALVVVPTLNQVVDGLPAEGKVRPLRWRAPVELCIHRGAVPGGEKVDRQTPQGGGGGLGEGRQAADTYGGRRINLSHNGLG